MWKILFWIGVGLVVFFFLDWLTLPIRRKLITTWLKRRRERQVEETMKLVMPMIEFGALQRAYRQEIELHGPNSDEAKKIRLQAGKIDPRFSFYADAIDLSCK